MRLGLAKCRGWSLTNGYIKKALKGRHQPLQPTDVLVGVEQKGVDMRIGIDVATLSLKRIVERIILISVHLYGASPQAGPKRGHTGCPNSSGLQNLRTVG